MRYRRIIEIIKLLFLFIKRNVFNVGILKSKLFRYIISICIIILIMLISILVFKFFDNTQSTIRQTTIVLDIYSISIFMWTFTIFLFMKILFMKKDSFMIFTQQLPVSRSEINISLLCFEVLIAIITISIISSSLIIALSIKYGLTFITKMICNTYLSGITWYIVLELIYSILILILDFFDLKKLKNVSIYCVFTIIFVCLYKFGYPKIVDILLFQYINNKGTSYLIIYSYIMDNYSFIMSLIVFIITNSILSLLILFIPKKDGLVMGNYLKLNKKSRKTNLFSCYLRCFSRRIDTYSYLIISIFIYFLLLITNVPNASYAILILSINGSYSYIQTNNLRMLMIQKSYSEIKDYIYLILSQCTYIFCVSIPVVIISSIVTKDIISNIVVFPSTVLSVIIFTLIGIVIPPKRENPFAVMAGFIVVFIIIFFTVLTCFITSFQMKYNIMILASVILFSIYYSINGLKTLKGEIRIEN